MSLHSDFRPNQGGCPACGRAEPHIHEGFGWGRPTVAQAGLLRGVPAEPRNEIQAIIIPVTPAQRSVLVELTRDGAENAVIAKRLHLSPETVKSHLKAIFGKDRVSMLEMNKHISRHVS